MHGYHVTTELSRNTKTTANAPLSSLLTVLKISWELCSTFRLPNGTSCSRDLLPTFIISGDADPVGDYGKGPYKVYRLLSERGGNVRLKLYSGARHELLNETNRSEVYRDVLAFYDSLTEKQ